MVCMFKSFHHIPKELMTRALKEIKRVLKPNALLYVSEPLFQGDQNSLISLFHDEQEVRIEAFEAIKEFVDKEEMKLFRELFFQIPVSYKSFEDFENRQMNLTFNNEIINKELHEKIKTAYESFANEKGDIEFMKPFRVDILLKYIKDTIKENIKEKQ